MKNIKILVAEDNKLNQMLVRMLLQKNHIQVDEASDGRQAIAKVEAIPDYDMILMDIQMPEMDGLEAARHIRGILHNDIPILAITGNDSPADIRACLDAGMNDHLSKPLQEQILIEKIKKNLRN